jgi:hypothetical protein
VSDRNPHIIDEAADADLHAQRQPVEPPAVDDAAEDDEVPTPALGIDVPEGDALEQSLSVPVDDDDPRAG